MAKEDTNTGAATTGPPNTEKDQTEGGVPVTGAFAPSNDSSDPSFPDPATSESEDPRQLFRRQRLVVALVLLTSYGYFTPAAQWNENSRYNLTRSVVSHGTLNIDLYHENTGDKSYRDGHFYSDKAPGLSFLGIPGYTFFLAARRLAGQSFPSQQVKLWPGEVDEESGRVARSVIMEFNPAYWRGLYLANLLSNGLLAALAGVMLFSLLMRRFNGRLTVSLFGTMAYCLGTLAWPYATLFYGHQPAASLLLIAFCLIQKTSDPGPQPAGRFAALFRFPGLYGLLGAVFGLTVSLEYPAAVACFFLAAHALVLAGKGRRLRAAVWMASFGLPFAILLAVYHTFCFGGPFSVGYQHLAHKKFAEGMSQGLLGVTYPRPSTALHILAGNHRGLLYLSPVLALSFVGIYRAWKRSAKIEVSVVLAVFLYFLALNSAYYMWDGGAASGPRHSVPMLGLLAPFIAVAYPTGKSPRWRYARWGCWFLFSLSVFNMLAVTAVGAEAPMHVWDPLAEYAWPNFFKGELSVNVGSTNVGRMFRLPGLFSLLPLLLTWAVAAGALFLPASRRNAPE